MRRILCVATLAMAVVTPSAAQDDDLDVLLDRIVTYLETYETQLSTLIADERFVQEEMLNRRRRAFGEEIQLRTRRVTESQVIFLRLPGLPEWLGIRDTRKVDGKEVSGSGITLAELMKNPGDDLIQRAAAMVEASSQHNLGGRRALTMPTVVLEALSARNHPRYIFKSGGRSRIEGTSVRRLDFEEFDEPTLVEGPDGSSLWSRGSAWVDPATGAIWRAELTVGPDAPGKFRRTALESRMRVDFTRDTTLGLLVPKELFEQFRIRGGIGQGRGRYSNFRKFAPGG